MATNDDPRLCATNVVEDVHNHDKVIGLKLSYLCNDCFFTVLLTHNFSSSSSSSPSSRNDDEEKEGEGSKNVSAIQDLLERFGEACTWTDRDKTIADWDEKFDCIWEEVENLVRVTAFDKIRVLGRQHGQSHQYHNNGSAPSPQNKPEEEGVAVAMTGNLSHASSSSSSVKILAEHLFPKSFTLQLVPSCQQGPATSGGSEKEECGGVAGIVVIDRPDLPVSLPFAVERGIPLSKIPSGLVRATPKDVKILKYYRAHVLKVQIGDRVFCCKLNNTGSQNSFLREFQTLQRVRNARTAAAGAATATDILNIRIPELQGVVVDDHDGGGGIVGLLIECIETTEPPDLMMLLQQSGKITDSLRRTWEYELSQTLQQLHSLGLTWGDAKTSNVLIDTHQRSWIIDFGGGFTKGWVDEELNDTQAGDLQGLENILLDIFGKR